MTTKVKLENVRLSFADSLLGDAKDYQDNKVFRHSATFLIDPASDNHKRIEAAIKKEAEATFGKKAEMRLEDLRPQANKFCYQKGDKKDYEGWEGMMALAGHRKASDGRPTLYNNFKDEKTGKPQVLTVPQSRIFSGCYVNATVEIYAQDGQNAGIRCGLIAVQYHKEGDSFGGASRANADDFDSIEAGSDADDLV